MGLVDYASDDSDAEQAAGGEIKASGQPQPEAAAKPLPPTFQKVVHKSNPHKIRVNLPGGAGNPKGPGNDPTSDEPEPKRIKLGSGGGEGRGINAFLPAPKRPAAPSGPGKSGPGRGKGLGPGVSLKTGAEPGFTREPMELPAARTEGIDVSTRPVAATNATAASVPASGGTDVSREGENAEVKPKGKVTRFMPLSVSRKPKPKPQVKAPAPTVGDNGKSISSKGASAGEIKSTDSDEKLAKTKPKISLFSVGPTEETSIEESKSTSDAYEPLLFGAKSSSLAVDAANQITSMQPSDEAVSKPQQTDGSQSLDTIAADLNLTASERRQLFGRAGSKGTGHGMAKAVSVVNFNTDAEYAANEELRAAGEQPEQQHRVVRTVNTSGKNSLRSLVNVVSNQGEALEDHFAKGRRNKQEAGSKYGW